MDHDNYIDKKLKIKNNKKIKLKLRKCVERTPVDSSLI